MVQFYLIAAIVLIILKCSSVVLFSWWLVLAPFYVPIVLTVSYVSFIGYNLTPEQTDELESLLDDDGLDTEEKIKSINIYFKLAIANFTNKRN